MKMKLFLPILLWGFTSIAMIKENLISLAEFRRAVLAHNEEIILAWINQATAGKIDVNERDHQGTALDFAMIHGHKYVPNLVAIKDIDVNSPGPVTGEPPIIDLIKDVPVHSLESRAGLISLLRCPMLKVNVTDDIGFTPLMLAAEAKNPESALALLARSDIDLLYRSGGWRPALVVMIQEMDYPQYTESLKKIVAVLATASGYTTRDWYNALRNARTKSITLMLLNAPGFTLSEYAYNKIGENCVDLDSRVVYYEKALLLWSIGAECKIIENVDFTPQLREIKEKGQAVYADILKALETDDQKKLEDYVQQGYSVNIKHVFGNTILHRAVIKNKLAIAAFLVKQNKYWLKAKNARGLTPLDLLYGLWGNQNDEWNDFIAQLPVDLAPDIQAARHAWELEKQTLEQAFKNTMQDMANDKIEVHESKEIKEISPERKAL